MSFRQTTLALYGDAGRTWLNALPSLLTRYAQEWDLTLEAPFENLSYNYAAPARRADGSDAVIKVGFPNDELRTEIAALRHFDGPGMVRLLEADEGNCAMLLERIFPGETLWDVDDEQATALLLNVMPQLWKPYLGEYPFPSTVDWARGFARLRKRYGDGTGSLDRYLVEKAENLFFDLLASSEEPVLLHGDLHHDNVLSTYDSARRATTRRSSLITEKTASSQKHAPRRIVLAIDPKGVLGEPCYDVGAFLRNPLPALLQKENPRGLMQRRVDMIVERLGFDRQRVVGWGFAQAVLSAIWCDEDGVDGAQRTMKVAEIFQSIQ
ncbi:MAG: aminoglycoside resistance protein [Anaerolineae bacterium]|jgi:streptomycin 6-kinase|nr:aminoglycoside resistance protein [Anaerolineae bacterium]